MEMKIRTKLFPNQVLKIKAREKNRESVKTFKSSRSTIGKMQIINKENGNEDQNETFSQPFSQTSQQDRDKNIV